jgi:hypothetical protein
LICLGESFVRTVLACLVGWLTAASADTAFVVVANHTEKPITCRVVAKGDKLAGGLITPLAPGEARAFPCGKTPVARYGNDLDKATDTELEPYTAYVFVAGKDKVELKGIEFAGKPVPNHDIPDVDRLVPRLKVPVRLLMDDANPLARGVWEPKLKKRFEEAAAVVGPAAGVTFDPVEIGEWASDPVASSLENLVSDLEEKEKPKPGGLVIGYTCRKIPGLKPGLTLLGPARGPLKPAILIRDGIPINHVDQVEVLIHELGHYFGAVRIPDPNSVMRPSVGDGKANLAKFEFRFDPVNVLLMNLWVEDLRSGKVKKWHQLRPETIARLGRVYDTVWKSYPDVSLAMACEDIAAAAPQVLAALTAPGPAPKVVAIPDAPARDPTPQPPAPAAQKPAPDDPRLRLTNPLPPNLDPAPKPAELSKQEKAIRRVIRGVTLRAIENAKKPDGGADPKLTGDALTDDLVRTAANVAAGEEESVRLAAFAVGLGLALDDSTILRNNPLVRTLCRNVEPDADRKERVAALGSPTVRQRRDWCQHFVVSVALAELVGPKLAEQAGVAKEVADMAGPSGFSFADLTADFAGVEFYNRLKKDSALLEKVKDKFTVADFMPDQKGVSDGLTRAEFEAQYGSTSDERYKKAVATIRERIAGCPAYKK